MKKSNMIIWDVDNTLFYWTKHYVEWIFTKNLHRIDTHNSSTWFKKEFIVEFNTNKERFTNRDKTDLFAVFETSLNRCQNIILSACGKHSHSYLVEMVAPYVSEGRVFTVDCATEKQSIISSYKELGLDVLVVDDKVETAEYCRNNNIKVACNLPVYELVETVNGFVSPKRKRAGKELLSAIGLQNGRFIFTRKCASRSSSEGISF